MMNSQLLERVRSLGDQERRILSLLTFGYPNKQIAGVLGLAETTVKSHITSILVALECSNRTQAALVGHCLCHRLSVEGIVGRRRAYGAIHRFMDRFEDVYNGDQVRHRMDEASAP
ncbi:helix-turn-helix transcriptional regulator [Hyphomicrobium sp.]|uniref:helix-turn-helix transcriptional regulator n=1 Tax=Hyphomicrobium sp. TaxID=82 RepID=UPI0025B96918|nr:helix-turn-helix transcriptional regulator [Hyphomicrobium sp.]MCC7252143.1 helix-turn-helix transcriptional regulator [Hyphomicrobium sp.]